MVLKLESYVLISFQLYIRTVQDNFRNRRSYFLIVFCEMTTLYIYKITAAEEAKIIRQIKIRISRKSRTNLKCSVIKNCRVELYI